MQQYTDLMRKIIHEGEWIKNERTGKSCKTIINVDLEYDFCPIVTTRKSYWKSAVAEFMGYIKGYDNASDFRTMGTKTWDANANLNQAWLNNPHRKGEDDMGRVYGVQGRSWRKPYYYESKAQGSTKFFHDDCYVDQLAKIYNNLKNGQDDRGEILSFYNVGEFHMGCLRPCIHTHQFSLVNGTLHLHSYQRSCDVCLGGAFNMVQCWFFLQLMAQITEHKVGKVYHKIVNAHIYEDQYETALIEASRNPKQCSPVMAIGSHIKTLEDVESVNHVDELGLTLTGYEHHPALEYPMST